MHYLFLYSFIHLFIYLVSCILMMQTPLPSVKTSRFEKTQLRHRMTIQFQGRRLPVFRFFPPP